MILGARIPGSGRTGGPGDTPGSRGRDLSHHRGGLVQAGQDAAACRTAPGRRPWRRVCRSCVRRGGPPRTITALLARHDHAIAPILARARSPRMGRKPKIGTAVDRDYETLRIDMQTLFRHVGIDMRPAAA